MSILSVCVPTVSKTPGKAPRPAPPCTVEVLHRPEPGLSGQLTITLGKCRQTYSIDPIDVDADFAGDGFRLEKCPPTLEAAEEGESVYYVLMAYDGRGHSCDCRGFQAHGHCKHVSALIAAREADLF